MSALVSVRSYDSYSFRQQYTVWGTWFCCLVSSLRGNLAPHVPTGNTMRRERRGEGCCIIIGGDRNPYGYGPACLALGGCTQKLTGATRAPEGYPNRVAGSVAIVVAALHVPICCANDSWGSLGVRSGRDQSRDSLATTPRTSGVRTVPTTAGTAAGRFSPRNILRSWLGPEERRSRPWLDRIRYGVFSVPMQYGRVGQIGARRS